MSGYDIIGDVHGQGDRLEAFLWSLGYSGAYFEHPDGRQAIFIGDLIDRGTQHAKVFDIVRRMDAPVLMGNHELNAIAYARKSVRGGFIRPHSRQNTLDHADFLAEYPFGSKAYKDTIKWFESFPIYHENKQKGFRLIHACWNDNALQVCAPYLDKGKRLKLQIYPDYDRGRKGSGVRGALDWLLKGPELSMPAGTSYLDPHGNRRDKTRLYWWQGKEVPHSESFQFSEDVIGLFSGKSLQNLARLRDKFKYASQVPVLFGHYNIDKAPFLTSAFAACVNFKYRLVAYRWDRGDRALSQAKLVHD